MIDSTGLGLHHVLAQTLVRVVGAGHGPANAVMLPHTIAALARRAPAAIAALDAAASDWRGDGTRSRLARRGALVALARRLQGSPAPTASRAIGVDTVRLPACAEAAAARPQLANTPPAADRDEILAIYEAAL